MKILFIEPCHVNFGGYFRAYNICLNLSKKKIEVDMLCAAGAKFQYHIKKTVINKYFTQYELPRFYFHFFLNGRLLRGLIALWFGLTGNYDIIHAAVPVQLESNIPAFILKLLGKKVVIDWDDYWEGSGIYGEYKIMKQYVAFCEKKAPQFFKNMVVVSDFLKNLAVQRGAKHVLKLINGVNKDQFFPQKKTESRKKLKLDPKEKYLIAFGNTYSNDRALLLFQVFEKIVKALPDTMLLFNLDPQKVIQDEKIEEKIDSSILKNIISIGTISQADQGYYLASADAVIFLMGDTDAERACFPIRIGSYINGEAVIILNDTNSEASNTLKPFNCAIIEKDLQKLSSRSIEFLKNPAMQKILHKNVLLAKEALLWEKEIEKLIAFYNTTLSLSAHASKGLR